jgi:hypothetical protein
MSAEHAATSSSVQFGDHLVDPHTRRREALEEEMPREIVVYPVNDATGGRKGKERAVYAPMSISVLAAIMETSNGRDKILVCVP